MRQDPKVIPRGAPRDLFGEIPVSFRDVQIWLYRVPKLAHTSRWRADYTRQYCVIDKIRAFKAAGKLAQVFGDECCDFCGELLARLPAPLPANPEDEINLLKRRIQILELLLMAPAIKKPVRDATLPASTPTRRFSARVF